MADYYISWGVSLLVLLALARWVGMKATGQVLGILIDGRGRYSLTHFQTVLWTIIILSNLIAVFIASGFDPTSLKLPLTLLGLMGVSAGSAVLVTAVKAGKELSSDAHVWKRGCSRPEAEDPTKDEPFKAKFAQIWLEEEGDLADRSVSITKYQNFLFTLLIVGAYVSLSITTRGIPDLPANVVYLIGISHGGYVGGKLPNKK